MWVPSGKIPRRPFISRNGCNCLVRYLMQERSSHSNSDDLQLMTISQIGNQVGRYKPDRRWTSLGVSSYTRESQRKSQHRIEIFSSTNTTWMSRFKDGFEIKTGVAMDWCTISASKLDKNRNSKDHTHVFGIQQLDKTGVNSLWNPDICYIESHQLFRDRRDLRFTIYLDLRKYSARTYGTASPQTHCSVTLGFQLHSLHKTQDLNFFPH